MTRVMIQRVNGNICLYLKRHKWTVYFSLFILKFLPLFFFFREVPKLKRKAPLSKKDKKEKAPKKEKEVAEIKVEGSENVDSVEDELKVEEETLEDPDGPRK